MQHAFCGLQHQKKKIAQLIFVVMGKQIFIDYQFFFYRRDFEDYLCDTLKELKMTNSKEEESNKVTM
jgi:hypothetical protein